MSFVPRTIEELNLDFPPELNHISASSITMALRCEEQFRQVYLQKQRKPPSLAQLFGRADHKAIERSMVQKIDSHEDLAVNEVMNDFVEAIEAEVSDSGGLGELEGEPTVKDYDDARFEGQRIVSGYHQALSPLVQPVAVEQEFVIDVPDVPVQVVGRIDLREANQIIDRKRTKRATAKPKPDWTLQGAIYQLAEPLPYRWHLSVTTKTPQFLSDLEQPLGRRDLTERTLRDVCLKLGFLYSKYGPDEVWPATGKQHDWACNYCGFRPTCYAWQV